jgi:hypothetical protein
LTPARGHDRLGIDKRCLVRMDFRPAP